MAEKETRSREQLAALLKDKEEEIERLNALVRSTEQEAVASDSEQVAHLKATLAKAKDQITALREEVDKLSAPPQSYGLVWRVNRDERTVDIYSSGRELRVNLHPAIEIGTLQIGDRVMLNDALNIIIVDKEKPKAGEEGKVVSLRPDLHVARVLTHADDTRDVILSQWLWDKKIREGDPLLICGHIAVDILPKSKEVEHLFLAESPTVTYAQVGGLDREKKLIRELIEGPYLYTQEFIEHGLKAPKGILFFGPPGCGKTLIAKAVANALGQKAGGQSRFLNIKGPELLNKYVGETERFIREVFACAKELANENVPVIIFFDEMDALFPVRGSQISCDTAGTIVPQFTTEMDGIEGFKNVIVIGATNRHDRIDPAVIRPGRFDHKIEIGRPDKAKARQIFGIYLTEQTFLHPQYFDSANYEGDYYIPKSKDGKPRRNDDGSIKKYKLARDPEKIRDYLMDMALDRIFDPEKELNQLLELTFRSGKKQVLYATDFISGAIIEAIVNKAKTLGFWRYIEGGLKKEEKGLKLGHLMEALEEEFASQEKLPSISNPDEWASIVGIREQIVHVKPLAEERRRRVEEKSKERKVETQTPGHYL